MKRKRESKTYSTAKLKKARVKSDNDSRDNATTANAPILTENTQLHQSTSRENYQLNDTEIQSPKNCKDSPTLQKKRNQSTPRKHRLADEEGLSNVTPQRKQPLAGSTVLETPQSVRSVRFKSIDVEDEQRTPQGRAKTTTPSKRKANKSNENITITPSLTRNADRSARKKVTRKLIERNLAGLQSEDEDAEAEEDELADIILNGDVGGNVEEDGSDGDSDGIPGDIKKAAEEKEQVSGTTDPPMKRGRGRPKGSRNKASSMPVPENLQPHELYFYQTRPGVVKTSNNTFPSHLLLNHEDYFAALNKHEDGHKQEREFLHSLHSASFDQWKFELENGYSVCLYGYGSKRALAMDFAEHLHREAEKAPKIVIVNGYNSTLTIRDILNTLANIIITPKQKKSSVTTTTTALPTQPTALLNHIISHLPQSSSSSSSSSSPPSNAEPITLIIHSIDAAPLRRTPNTQSILATLAQHPSIHLLATADTPNFPLLWDTSASSKFCFVYHDATTFAPFGPEIDAVDAVNELLGRRSRRIGGKDGVAFVLRSLPENARALFRILLVEQIGGSGLEGTGANHGTRGRRSRAGGGGADDGDGGSDAEDGDDNVNDNDEVDENENEREKENAQAENGLFGNGMRMHDPFAPGSRDDGPGARSARQPGRRKTKTQREARLGERGTEYRILYHKAVENFVCTSEMAFRTLLKEFHDHAIVEARRDGTGVERLWVPFRNDELEMLLDEMDAA